MLKNLLLLTGFSTFSVIIIIAFDVYHKIQISSLSENTKVRVISIPPTFDNKAIVDLKKRTPITVNLTDKSSVTSEDSKSTATNPAPSPNEGLLATPTITTSQQTSSESANTRL